MSKKPSLPTPGLPHADHSRALKFVWRFLVAILVVGAIAYFGGRYYYFQNLPAPTYHDATGSVSVSANGTSVKLRYEQSIELTGHVAAIHSYASGTDVKSALAPYDMGLTWGFVSNDLDELGWPSSDASRTMSWVPVHTNYTETHGGSEAIDANWLNAHLIPANDAIASKIAGFSTNIYIHLKGFVISAEYTEDHATTTWTPVGDNDKPIYVTEISQV